MTGLIFLILFIAIILIVTATKFALRKIFNINKVKRKAFSYNHINRAHRIADWTVRLTALAVYLIFMYQLYYHDISVNLFLFIMTLVFTSESFVRAYFEWKASPDPKQSILSLGEGVVLIIIVLVIIQFDVLNLLLPRAVG